MRYGAVLADPPWHTETWSSKGRGRCPDGRIINGRTVQRARHYETMPLAELMALPIEAAAAPDCRLFLWTTDAHLPQALDLGRAWGFRYSTVAFVWNKLTSAGRPFFGGGKATRKGAELCLLFLRGSLNRRSASVRQVITAPVREHSRKPDETYERIETLVGGPYLELFARSRRDGWDDWGDQAGRWHVARMNGRDSTLPPRPAESQLGLFA